ncbi:Fanconi anemia group I protein homolog [Epargyreus clarus]|uniref:Fanconi anemia group I protein homolog n=1 Tax=Epargyreus clarus TaxID=520877 RepID=UPI003C303A15
MNNSTDIDQILRELPQTILTGKADLDNMFNNMSNDSQNKIRLVDKILEVLRANEMSQTYCENIARRVCLELPRLPPEAVTRWCSDSIQSIIDDSDRNMIWCVMVPECMYALSSHDMISCNENNETVTITSKEYKKRCLQKLLDCNFNKEQLMQLAIMTRDLQLPRNEHRKFVTKICTFIKVTPPQDLPPLVHQLIKLCRLQNLKVVLAHLSDHFHMHLYNKLTTPIQDSESTTTMDIDDISQYNENELGQCLSTCALFLTQEPEWLARELREWPRSQLPRAPAVLLFALALTEKGKDFRAACLDVMRLAIEASVIDEMLSREYAAARVILRPDVSITALLEKIVESEGICPMIINGLIHLCFALLANRKTKADRRACANIGISVLVKVAKVHEFSANQILYIMADRLASDTGNPYYAECLAVLCKETLSVERQAKLRDILQECRASAPDVLEAVQPLLNFSSGVRDALIMTCTKRLYCRDPAERALAARGLLAALRALRGAGAPRSQDDERGAVHVHASQDGDSYRPTSTSTSTCENIILTLRRCLGQEASVKELLYSRWYACVRDKTSLHDEMLEMLHSQLSKYLADGEINLSMDQCVNTTPTAAVLVEPIGHLLYLIAQLLEPTTVESDMESLFCSQDNSSGFIRNKLKAYLADLSKCNLLSNVDMENLVLTDPTPESKASCMKVQQLLQVYEALIAHHVMQWSPTEGHADIVYQLYKAHNQLTENTKQSPKKSTAKKPRLAKDKNVPFKPLPCLWDLSLCHRVLELNYGEEVPWSSAEERSSLRARGVWQRWAARAVAAALAARHARQAARAARIAALVYDRCLCRFQDLYEFDDDTALGCLEVFHACLKLFSSPNLNMDPSVLSTIIGDSAASPTAAKALILGTLRSILFMDELPDASQYANGLNKKIFKEVVDVTTTLLKIPTDEGKRTDSNDNVKLVREIDEWEQRVCGSTQDCSSLVAPLLSAAAAVAPDAALLDELLARLATVLGTVDTPPAPETQSTQPGGPLCWVRAGNAAALLAAAAAHAAARLAAARHVVVRARDLADMRERATDDSLPSGPRQNTFPQALTPNANL